MQVEARAGQSVFLRGWGEYERYGLKLTESPQSGLGHMALRAWSPEALDRRVAAIEAAGLGTGWIDGDLGHGPAYRFTDPDGHVMELYFETEKYEPPEELRPSLKNQPQRYVGRGAAVKRLDHVNVLAQDVPANRAFAEDVLGYRLYERIVLDDGTETGAWISLTIAAHELIYVADFHRPAAACTTSPSGWTRARRCCAPPTCSWSTTCRSRRRPRSTRSRRASSSTASSRAATAWRSPPAATSSTTPTASRPCGARPSARRGRPGACKTVESFHTYGTPPV